MIKVTVVLNWTDYSFFFMVIKIATKKLQIFWWFLLINRNNNKIEILVLSANVSNWIEFFHNTYCFSYINAIYILINWLQKW